jgi:hypothetical protein
VRPTVAITSPADGTTVSSLSAIVGTAGDTGGSNLSAVQLTLRRVSDNTFWTGTTWSATSFNLPVQVNPVTPTSANWRCAGMPRDANLVDGVYKATATAVDRAGNTSTPIQVQFTLKRTAAITAPAVKSSGVLLSSASATADGTVQLVFSGALAGSATDTARYGVTVNGAPVEIFGAQLKSAGMVVLATGELAAGARAVVTYDLQDTGGASVSGTANVIVE